MAKYQYSYSRELTEEDFASGQRAIHTGSSGTFHANSVHEVRDACLSNMQVPADYKMKIQDMGNGRWKEFGAVKVERDGTKTVEHPNGRDVESG
jgi:hypothetical protein